MVQRTTWNRLCSVHQIVKSESSRRAGTGDSSGSRKRCSFCTLDYVCGYRGALKACSEAQTRSNRSRRAGSESSTAVAVEAAIYRLQQRQRFSGCSGGRRSALVVGTAIQRLWWRQRFSDSGSRRGQTDLGQGNAEGLQFERRKEEKIFRQDIRKLVGGLYP